MRRAALSAALPVTTNGASALVGSDVGAVGAAGSTTFGNGRYTVAGAGADIYGGADAFQFAATSWTGDGAIIARVVSQSNTSPSAKAGVMIRENMSAGARNAFVAVSPSNGTLLQNRASPGAPTTVMHGPATAAPYWVQVVRAGQAHVLVHPGPLRMGQRIAVGPSTPGAQLERGRASPQPREGTLSTPGLRVPQGLHALLRTAQASQTPQFRSQEGIFL